MTDQTTQHTCPHCGQPHPVNAQFCPVTGQEIAVLVAPLCPNCGREVQPAWVRCPSCATILRPEAVSPAGVSSTPPAISRLRIGCLLIVLVFLLCLVGGGWFLWGDPGGWEKMVAVVIPPTATSTLTATPTLTPTGTFTPSPTPIPSATPPPSPTPTETPLPTATLPPTSTPAPTLPPAFTWNFDVVQRAQSVGYFTSMLIDPQGNLHIAYFQDNSDIVHHAHNETGQWQFDYVVGGQETGYHLSFDLDVNGQPHFAFHILGNKQTPEIRYIVGVGATQKLFRVFGTYSANSDVSLELGADGNPHITFLDGYTFNVKYTSYTPQNGWAMETVAAANPDCQSLPLVLDAGGTPHLVYQGQTGGLYYATRQGNNWISELVDEAPGAGHFSALALDSTGQPHIAYYDREQKALKYATRAGDAWEITVVDATADVGQYPSMAIDSLGQIYISYYDASNTALKLAHGRGGQWDLYTVDDNGNVGKWNSLVVKSGGIPYISYLDEDNEDLKLAWAIPANP